MMRWILGLSILTALLCAVPAASAFAQQRDPGCEDRTMVSTGGRMPNNLGTLAVRWTGYSNFELVYQNQILLLDAYFDRGSIYPPLGFKAEDVSRAHVILVGHGHHDHMSDAASVAIRTGAVVVGAPITTEKLLAQRVPPAQVRTVTGKGGEALRFEHFTVQPILSPAMETRPPMCERHSVRRLSAQLGRPHPNRWRSSGPFTSAEPTIDAFRPRARSRISSPWTTAIGSCIATAAAR